MCSIWPRKAIWSVTGFFFLLCIVLLSLYITDVPKAILRITSVNHFSLGWNSIKEKIAENNGLDSKAAIQDLKSKEATEKYHDGWLLFSFKGDPQVGGIVSIADAISFYKFNLGKLYHTKYWAFLCNVLWIKRHSNQPTSGLNCLNAISHYDCVSSAACEGSVTPSSRPLFMQEHIWNFDWSHAKTLQWVDLKSREEEKIILCKGMYVPKDWSH